MTEWQRAVVDEKAELVARMATLLRFIANGSVFKGLAPEDQDLLRRQEAAMASYLDILERRIMRFDSEAVAAG